MYVQCIPSPEKLVPEAPQVVEMQEPEKVSTTLLMEMCMCVCMYVCTHFANVHACMYVVHVVMV